MYLAKDDITVNYIGKAPPEEIMSYGFPYRFHKKAKYTFANLRIYFSVLT